MPTEEQQTEEKKEPVKLLTRDQVVNADDRRFEIIHVPEWGGSVRIRSLTEPEYHDFRDSTFTRAGKEPEVNQRIMRACLCAACIIDASGQPIFKVDDLKGKSAHALAIVWKAAAKLCGLDDDDIGEILKNCESGQAAGRS